MKSINSNIECYNFRNIVSAIVVLIILNIPNCYAQEIPVTKVSPVVSGSWLKDNLSEPGLIVLHVAGAKQDYDNGHIPGAGFLWPGYVIISNENESVVPAPTADIAKLLRSLGVNNNSHIVLCGIYGNIIPVCRVFVNLEHVGLKGRVSVLDGGFDAWKAEGYPVSTEKPDPVKGKFTASVNENLVNGEWMMANLKNSSYCIVDARARMQYDGSTGLPRPGHIPGAKNLPPSEIYDSKTTQFFDDQKLTKAFKNLDIPQGTRPVFYCHTGNSASVAYVAALAAGYDPFIYDGSMEEWGSKFEWPIEK
jgi:thiosulfate/3-mercaptopyruvate sulfurtransferase